MKTITTTLVTKAVFSDDDSKRYLLKKTWDEQKDKMTIIMLTPSMARGIELDTTTQLVLNNVARLGYGRVSIVNLFALLDDFQLQKAEAEDRENLEVILQEAATANCVVYAPGVGKSKNKVFLERQKQVLEALQPYEDKLYCLCDAVGEARLQHPLSPAVRTWYLSKFKTSELLGEAPVAREEKQKKKTSKIKEVKDIEK